jgi:hypothetical protein
VVGFPRLQAREEVKDECLVLLEERDGSKLLSDSRQMGAVDKEDQLWSIQDWAPRANAAGIEHIAFVMPEQAVAELSINSVLNQVDDDTEREYFDDFDEATEWLRAQ